MPAAAPVAPERPPRRARYLIPRGTPRRSEVLAGLALAALAAGALFAQLTLLLTVIFQAISRLGRLRPLWLAIPAACGTVWVLAMGARTALAWFGAVPRAVAALLAAAASDPARSSRLARLPGVIAHGLAGQLPVSLIAAAGIAAGAWWLNWLHTDEWDLRPARTGLIILCRRWLSTAFVRSGGVLTRDGACLGVDTATGRPAAVSWAEAAGGVLVTGEARAAVSAAGFQLVHAAIRRRKPVIVADLAGDAGLPGPLAAACAAAGATLHVFGPGGRPGAVGGGCYDPLRERAPASAAGLVAGMIDWGDLPDPARRACHECFGTALAVMAAAPGDPGTAALDDLLTLLRPGQLRARMEQVPGWHPGRSALRDRAEQAADRLEADEAAVWLVAQQLAALRASALGRWLAPVSGPQHQMISLPQVVRQRDVAFFPLDEPVHGGTAEMIGNLVALDIAAVYTELHARRAGWDGLAWFSQCDAVDPGPLAGLVRLGQRSGFAAVLSTTSPGTAALLAGEVSVWVAGRLGDYELAARLAPLTGSRPARAAAARSAAARAAAAGPGRNADGTADPAGITWSPVVPAEALCGLADGEFTLVAGRVHGAGQPRRATRRGPRVVARGRAIAGRVPAPARPVAPGDRVMTSGRA